MSEEEFTRIVRKCTCGYTETVREYTFRQFSFSKLNVEDEGICPNCGELLEHIEEA